MIFCVGIVFQKMVKKSPFLPMMLALKVDAPHISLHFIQPMVIGFKKKPTQQSDTKVGF
jgi:hypothetical protein